MILALVLPVITATILPMVVPIAMVAIMMMAVMAKMAALGMLINDKAYAWRLMVAYFLMALLPILSLRRQHGNKTA